jgi:predicted GNAT family N-acyltransferase
LRIPLGLNVYDEDLREEKCQIHLGLFDNNTLLASVILKDLGNGIAKLRQMVVDESRQGEGLGKKLIHGLELIAKDRGFSRIEMAARSEASGFYRKMGYLPEGRIFKEVGIDHIRMFKSI